MTLIRRTFFLCLLFFAALSAQAQTKVICSSETVPSGWMITDISTSYTSCTHAQNDIFYITSLAGKTDLNVCWGQQLPSGWLIRDTATAYTMCGNAGVANDIWSIKNTAGQTDLTVCSGQSLPSGWEIRAVSSSGSSCQTGFGSTNNVWTIHNKSIACSLSVSSNVIGAGQAFSLTISGTNLPYGSSGYWYGTKNGLPDANGEAVGSVPTTVNITNGPGLEGNYSRSVQIRNSTGQPICTTNTVSATLLPTPTCSLSVDRTDVPAGQSVMFTVGGSNLPSGVVAYWYGTRNGVTDVAGGYLGGVPTSGSFTNVPGAAGSYTRYLVLQNASGVVCTTNQVGVVLE